MKFEIQAYQKALLFAASAHGTQQYHSPQGTVPYIVHPVAVAAQIINMLSMRFYFDAKLAISCALLHDTLEDTQVSKQQLATIFGSKITEGVSALSKNELLPAAERMTDSLERINRQPTEIKMVKMADRICNLSEPPEHWNEERIKSYHLEAQYIHTSLASSCPHLASKLKKAIDNYSLFFSKKSLQK